LLDQNLRGFKVDMPTFESDQIQSWLQLLCQMLPGACQAVVIQGSDSISKPIAVWPATDKAQDEVITAARLASSQNKRVTTTLSSGQDNNSAVETIIAMPLVQPGELNATLAVQVSIKPSQQSVVMQILQWGDEWLGLLWHPRQCEKPETLQPSAAAPPKKEARSYASRLIFFTLLLLAGTMTLLNGDYRVTASAHLEGKIQRAIVAPFDGYITAAHVRAGETVATGDVIAELDTEELLLQQQRYAAEKNEYIRQYRKALSTRDQTQAHIFKSQVSQADAQLELLEKKIERSSLVSTLDGVIISGDLSRSLGAPVKTGDLLFEVAPLDEYRLIIFVDEKQVIDVQPGQSGTLTLKALPGSTLPLVVHKVSPVFSEDEKGIAYRVEAQLTEHFSGLRPGMEGVAKIDIDRRSFAWIYLHELFDVIRLWAWRWQP
jgi:multidrug resistance efflux pump